MSKPKTDRIPSYRLHKARGCAVVTIDGRNHYLGKYDSPESREKYHRLVHEWLAGKPAEAPPPDDPGPTIEDLILRYWGEHVTTYYRKNGAPTSEQGVTRNALRYVRRLYGSTPAKEFGPLALKAVREAMIERGRSRTGINRDIHRIRLMFRWGVEQEILPVTVHQALLSVPALARGRTEARESAKVRPVPPEIVEATLPFLLPQVRAMVQLQLLTGARPGEVTSMRPRDVDRSDPDCWLYTPESHKTEHHDATRKIYLGAKSRAVLQPFLDGRPADAYCFSPREAVATQNAARKASRRTPMTPSQRQRSRKSTRAGRASESYKKDAYRKAIAQACDRAFPHPVISKVPVEKRTDAQREELKAWRRAHRWHPHQLRHNAATELRARFGVETAQAVLGHGNVSVTELYAEKNERRAKEAMIEIG